MFTIELTKRQKDVLNFIKGYIKTHGYSPTLREIARGTGIKTPRGVKTHLIALSRKGYITFQPGKARSISILKKDNIPLIGMSSAGFPINSEEAHLESFTIDEKLIGSGKHFMVKIAGDSMTNRGIEHGDLVVIKEDSSNIREGDVVLVRINGEVTLKTLFKKTHSELVLKPENPQYPTIRISSEESVEIIGKAILVIKKL